MIAPGRWLFLLGLAFCLHSRLALGQIDPVKRELIEFGYNAALQGHPPLSAYAFYYRNEPDFLRTNLTLRLAIAPTYIDSELGISQALGPHTDLGIGFAGGGFADSYYEIRDGKFLPQESFDGHGGEMSLSLYHLFNPGQTIPLYGVLHGAGHFSTYAGTSDTAQNFAVPADMGIFKLRSGMRWGGREPTLFPTLAMELSLWYEGDFRSEQDVYGFGDRRVRSVSHSIWAEALLAYTLTNLHHSFYVNLTAGTTADADRFSAFRLGGFLPMVAEFPLSLPGYYYQELSARQFFLAGGNYIISLDKHQRWNFSATASTALVNYLEGFEQPGHWRSGVGAGVFYTSRSWRVMVGYGYGVDAIRSGGLGAHTIGLLLQLDLSPAKEIFFKSGPPTPWQGLQRVLGVLGS